MRRLGAILILLFLLLSDARAQKADGIIKGKLLDTLVKQPVADATVSVIDVKDSSLLTYALTSTQGVFEIKFLPEGSYRIVISHQAYQPWENRIVLNTTNKLIDLGSVVMDKQTKILGEVVVTSTVPIVIKGDTVQFNASAFATKPNSTAEDLLKKLPGMEVDREGNVKSQGEQVQKVLVDGKEFFGNDPKLATRNITAEMIESIQVFDDMSDQAKFTKIDDGSRSKTLNIKLKKDRKKGLFARGVAGYGDNNRYETNLNINKFRDGQRFSLLFNTNNVNKQGFSDNTGSKGGSTGLTRSTSAGLNYNDEWGNKIRVTGSYFFSDIDAEQLQLTSRRSTFIDSIATFNRDQSAVSKSSNHRFNFRFEYQIDSANSILYTPNFNVQRNNSASVDTSFAYSKIPSAEYLSIVGTKNNTNSRDAFNWGNNLLYRHRFGKMGRTVTVGWNKTIGNTENEGIARSNNIFYNPDGTIARLLDQNQQSIQKTTTNNNTLSASYTEPIEYNKLLELNYTYTRNENISDRKTFNYRTLTGEYDSLNLLLTNRFENIFLAHRFGVNYRVQEKKYNYQFGVGVQQSELESNSFLASAGKDSITRQNYVNFFPTASFAYTPVRGKNFQVNYNGRTNQPNVSQLQNVLDVSDPLNVRTGNPDLKQEFNHNAAISYNSFEPSTSRFIAVNINMSATANKIVNSIDTLGQGVQLIRPENVGGNYRASSFITMGIPFKNAKLKGSNVNFSNNLSFSREVSLLYKQKNVGRIWIITQGAGLNLNKDKLNFGVKANVTYTNVFYSVNRLLNEGYFTQSYSGDVSYNFKGEFTLTTDFDYIINTGRADGFNQNIPLWNASFRKRVFRKKNGEFRFSVIDILNQNQSIIRSTGDNYIQDTRSMVLRRYFMLSFLFNFNRMGGKSSPVISSAAPSPEKVITNAKIN